MLKIKELFKEFIETQKNINTSIKELKEDLKPQIDTIKLNNNELTTCSITIDRIDNCIKTNIYTKEQTVETINKEIDYRKEYEKCLEENGALLNLIENYCKYKDKYEVLKLFKEIDKKYIVQKVEG